LATSPTNTFAVASIAFPSGRDHPHHGTDKFEPRQRGFILTKEEAFKQGRTSFSKEAKKEKRIAIH
jgi:hypothetical protein